MRLPVAPFLTPSSEMIDHGGWHIVTTAGDEFLPSDMPHWDYQTTLDLAADVRLDRAAITESCEIEPGSGLAVLVTRHSDHTRSERLVQRFDLPKRPSVELSMRFSLRGHDLGGTLTLKSFLVVTDPKPRSEFAPSRSGSIIWRSQQKTRLQGIGSQFPTDASDFSKTRPSNADAAWELAVDLSDLDASFMAAARLTLNSGHPDIGLLLDGSEKEATKQLRRTLRWDITRQLVTMALDLDDVVGSEVDAEAVSVQGILRNTLSRVWPRESPETLQSWWRTDRSRIELGLQNHCRLL